MNILKQTVLWGLLFALIQAKDCGWGAYMIDMGSSGHSDLGRCIGSKSWSKEVDFRAGKNAWEMWGKVLGLHCAGLGCSCDHNGGSNQFMTLHGCGSVGNRKTFYCPGQWKRKQKWTGGQTWVCELPADKYGLECWTSGGCSGDTGKVCEYCGKHDNKDMICCQPGHAGNHEDCERTVYARPDYKRHQCVVKPEKLPETEPEPAPVPNVESATLRLVLKYSCDDNIGICGDAAAVASCVGWAEANLDAELELKMRAEAQLYFKTYFVSNKLGVLLDASAQGSVNAALSATAQVKCDADATVQIRFGAMYVYESVLEAHFSDKTTLSTQGSVFVTSSPFSSSDLITEVKPCYLEKTKYPAKDMKVVSDISRYTDCQLECARQKDCKYWSLDSRGDKCHLKGEYSEGLMDEGYLSGPRLCNWVCTKAGQDPLGQGYDIPCCEGLIRQTPTDWWKANVMGQLWECASMVIKKSAMRSAMKVDKSGEATRAGMVKKFDNTKAICETVCNGNEAQKKEYLGHRLDPYLDNGYTLSESLDEIVTKVVNTCRCEEKKEL